MKKAWIIALNEWAILLRDRQALGLLFVMPLVLIVFLSLAMQDVYRAKVGRKIHLSLVTPLACEKDICAQLRSELQRFGYGVAVLPILPDPVEIALVLPADTNKTVALLKQNSPLASADRVQMVYDPLLDQSLRALVEAHLLIALQNILLQEAQAEFRSAGETAAIPNATRVEGLVVAIPAGGFTLPNPAQQTVPAWTLFGMFFILIPISSSLLRDRQLGIFKRLLSFPLSRAALLAGKVAPYFLINILQFIFMFGAGLLLPLILHLPIALHLHYGALVAITLACALAATSYGLMVACLVKSAEQASAFGALSVVILAVLGGVMIPRFVMPGFMQSFSRISPLYWGLEAYQDVLVRQQGLASAGPKIAVLVAFSIACGAISWFRFQWHEG